MKKLPPFIRCRLWFGTLIWLCTKDQFQILNESLLKRTIPDFSSFTRKVRNRKAKAFLDNLSHPLKLKWSRPIPNVDISPYGTPLDLHIGARTLLSLPDLFPDRLLGLRILADLLAGMRCSTLREIEPDFHPAMHLRKANPEQIRLFSLIAEAVVTIAHHKHGKMSIKRMPILDYGSKQGAYIQDFSRIKVRVKRHCTAVAPIVYSDTVALVIGPDKKQTTEAEPFLKNASVFFLNGAAISDWAVDTIPPTSVSSYDPKIAAQLEDHREHTAWLLYQWWRQDSYAWAEGIIQSAYNSFGKTDDRYITVTLAPKKLRDAIRFCVLSSFQDMLRERKILPDEELSTFRDQVQNAFYPSQEDGKLRHVESPETFLSIMRTIVQEQAEKIAGINDIYHKADKLIGAWRSIASEDYLILPEIVWSRVYAQVARKSKDVDTAFLKRENWERDLQKILCQANVIKQASSGFRYRYNLYGTTTRDKTYVIAIPKCLLHDPFDVQKEGQTVLVPDKSVCPIPSPEDDKNLNLPA